jgi:hypothetical protein
MAALCFLAAPLSSVVAQQGAAYTIDQIIELIRGEVSDERILSLVSGPCLNFDPAEEIERLTSAHASASLIAGLLHTCRRTTATRTSKAGVAPTPVETGRRQRPPQSKWYLGIGGSYALPPKPSYARSTEGSIDSTVTGLAAWSAELGVEWPLSLRARYQGLRDVRGGAQIHLGLWSTEAFIRLPVNPDLHIYGGGGLMLVNNYLRRSPRTSSRLYTLGIDWSAGPSGAWYLESSFYPMGDEALLAANPQSRRSAFAFGLGLRAHLCYGCSDP